MKIAIVKLSALGDIIHSMVALEFIKKAHPNIQIDWIVEECFSDILRHNPNIDNILTLNLKSLKKNASNLLSQIKLIKTYSKNNYDLVIDAQGLLKSAIVARMICKNVVGFNKNSIREKIAFYFYKNGVNIAYDENTILRNAKVLSQPLNFSISEKELLEKKPFLHFKNEDKNIYKYLFHDQMNIFFVIGSTSKNRIYPKEKLVNIINALEQNAIILWGNESEQNDAFFIQKHSSFAKALTKKYDLNSLKALISKCDLVIGNDTGPTHMAWGLNVPSITLFGYTPENRVLQTSINKTIKSNSIVNPLKLDKNDDSIKNINEDKIIKLARELL